MEFLTTDTESGRACYLAIIREEDVAAISLDLPHEAFACLIVWDVDRSKLKQISALAKPLIRQGCAYMCAWGENCDLVDDMFDWAWMDHIGVFEGARTNDEQTLMTTWHDEEPLDEALWFLLRGATPTEGFGRCDANVVILIDPSPGWEATIRDSLMDIERWEWEVLKRDGDLDM